MITFLFNETLTLWSMAYIIQGRVQCPSSRHWVDFTTSVVIYLSQTTINKTLPHQHVLYCQVNLCIKVIFNKVIVHLQLVNTYPVDFVSYEIQFSPVPFDWIPYSQLPW